MNEAYGGGAPGQGRSVDAQDGALLGRARMAPDTPDRSRDVRGDPQALTHRDKRLIAISMMLPVFLGSVDQSILASALPTIGGDVLGRFSRHRRHAGNLVPVGLSARGKAGGRCAGDGAGLS